METKEANRVKESSLTTILKVLKQGRGNIILHSHPRTTIDFSETDCSAIEKIGGKDLVLNNQITVFRIVPGKIKVYTPEANSNVVAKSFRQNSGEGIELFYKRVLQEVF